MSRRGSSGMWQPATFAAWVIQPMTTMIRKSRALVAASILTAVIMSFPSHDIRGDGPARRSAPSRQDLPDRLATEHLARQTAHPLRGFVSRREHRQGSLHRMA